ncbi:uncharacterized protein LOC124167662 [Ischnura elegans]|uniref:uncharacterized protein LOC124167662 n=1 Tax=Ischnura elegans TaxID=197161 RepID=UPI001ED8AFAF|nr:uncharacterized protein LOC124167662 [Ischnura elegans]
MATRGQLLFLAACMMLCTIGHAQNSCRTPDRAAGQCISIDSCDAYRSLLSQRPLSPETVSLLRRAQCGFQRNRPLVCCPSSTQSSGGVRPVTTQTGGQGGGGTRPNANELFGLGGGGSSGGGGATVTTGASVSNHPNWRLLRTDTCGADVSDRIFGGEEANLKEYPWLALLQYQTSKGRQFLCGGSLISTRYVLTAAHCVTGIGNVRLVAVRLGEHNTDTDPDCVNYDDGRVCGDRVQDFNVAEVISHPQYRSESRDKHHDIALIRLDRAAPITSYIVPICIPNGSAVTKRYESDTMIVAGWGRTENKTASNVKLWVRVPVMSNSACQPIYQRQLTLNANQMCAGGQQGKDSCRGDSGGPLMAVDTVVPSRRGGQWVIAGVVSIGPQQCATAGRPGIYTRVGPYVQWILDSLKWCAVVCNGRIQFYQNTSRRCSVEVSGQVRMTRHIPSTFLLGLTITTAVILGCVENSTGQCFSGDGRHLTCKSLSLCQPYKNMLLQRPLLPNTVSLLRMVQCGFQGNRPKVCCPYEAEDSGKQPNGPKNQTERPADGNGGKGQGTIRVDQNEISRHPNWKLLDSSKCGAEVTYRIFGGEEAQIGEYPWLALLEYRTKEGIKPLCGGSLLNDLYVLTAAHCVQEFPGVKLLGVRLGEHNVETDPDCQEYGEDSECADPVQRRRVSEAVCHPKYKHQRSYLENDIALIRMHSPVTFSDFIVPICLPNGDALVKEYLKQPLFVAGWGRTENSSHSKVKLWVSVPVVTNEDCSLVYASLTRVTEEQMCAGGQAGKDTCMGDSGGPLMVIDDVVPGRRGGQWVVIGIVSAGPVACALGGKPGIYTRVPPHMSWILDNLRP